MKNIIGIFGLICSGKSSFSKLLAKELNALYIDADIIGHEALNDKIKKEELIKALNSFIGTYEQEVPIYSAVKINGKKLYEYAICNIDVTLPKRNVTIHDI